MRRPPAQDHGGERDHEVGQVVASIPPRLFGSARDESLALPASPSAGLLARMSSELPDLAFQQQSVVVLSPAISPLTIQPKLLADLKVIPADWQQQEAIGTPLLAVLKYPNGVSLLGEPGKLTISEPPHALDKDSRVYEMAISYATAFGAAIYGALGLNWNLSISREDAQQWLIRTFLPSAPWRSHTPEVVRVNPSLTFRTDPAECNLQFADAARHGSEPQPRVMITSNFHHQGPFDLTSMRAKIEDWPARKAQLMEILQGLF